MTLRARLTLFFVGIVVVPLIAAGFALRAVLAREVDRRAEARLEAAAQAVRAVWQERLRLAEREVSRAAEELGPALADPGEAPSLDRVRGDARLDFLVATTSGEGVVASSVGRADYGRGIPTPEPDELGRSEAPPGVLRARVEIVAGPRSAALAGGWFAGRQLARDFTDITGLEAAIVRQGGVVAATGPGIDAPETNDGAFRLADGRFALAVPVAGGDGAVVLAGEAPTGAGTGLLWLVAAIGLVLSILLGLTLAGLVARPLGRLAEGARQVAGGNLDARLEPEGGGDVAHLADAFNAMTANLRAHVSELRGSRDELRRNLERLGETLRSTHDLSGMLGVVLETAVITMGARAGAVFLQGPSARGLFLESAHGYAPPPDAQLTRGRGIAGRAAEGVTVLVPSASPSLPAPPMEPEAATAVAVPLVRGDRTIGVMALYGRNTPEPFDEHDADTLGSFAAQASVAVENVLLHQEAQRLSITDGLTGVWNRRFLQLTLAKELERAQRFGRPVSVVMLDLDRFKDVNDTHGHQRGDEILVEVARRLTDSVRASVDIVVRYGGEEFVLVLPETPLSGATVVAEKVWSRIRDHPFESESGPPLRITVSLGAASYPDSGTTAAQLLRVADESMYRAKQAGRDRVVATS